MEKEELLYKLEELSEKYASELIEARKKVDDSDVLDKLRPRTLAKGIRSTLKVIQTIEDERIKCKEVKYETEIEELVKENKELKAELQKYLCNKDFIRSIVSRAIKLYNYLADKFNKSKILSQTEEMKEQWMIIDQFSKQARSYIRMSETNERSLAKLKKAKGKFIDYVEKEVNELTKGWSLIEEEREKLRNTMQSLLNREEVRYNYKNKKGQLEEEIMQLEARRKSALSDAENHERRARELKKSIAELLTDKDRLLETARENERYEEIINDKKSTLKELNDEIFEHEYILEKQKEDIKKYKATLGLLNSELPHN